MYNVQELAQTLAIRSALVCALGLSVLRSNYQFARGQAGNLAVVTALPLVETRAVPVGGAPAGLVVAVAVPLGDRPWVAAHTYGRGESDEGGRAVWDVTGESDSLVDACTD